MAKARDNFKKKVKVALAHRAGHRCSNPECEKLTTGPSSVETEFVNIGEAAHITAASLNGPRYDHSISPAERASIRNGLWLCANCADLVDRDDSGHEVALLRKWKKDAEERARIDAFTNRRQLPTKVIFELDDADRAFIRDLALPAEDTADFVAIKMSTASLENIETYLNERDWPEHVITLNLTALEDSEKTSVTLEGIAQGTHTAEAINIISSPGTGKTTTLIKLAETILATGQTVAAYIPLGEWADRPDTWFDFLRRKHAFRTFKDEHFKQLAYKGRLVLLLDGWNELTSDARRRATHDLEALKREFPMIGIVVGTRRQALPINGAVIEIQGLSEDQQMELARKIKGQEGEAVVDQAWRNSGLRELISIPLYLTALLSTTRGSALPQTKEELLNRFVNEHENEADKAETLRTELFGFHKDILIALSVAANNLSSTSIPDDTARATISQVLKALESRGQLAPGLQPAKIIDVLVDAHLLIRTSSAGSVEFQHQQFQEWYASFEVESLMLAASQGVEAAGYALRDQILNWPAWEESILFTCERLSRKDAAGKDAVSASILETLGIDPMLAAEMIFRATPEVWSKIRDQVIGFAKRWHTSGEVDRAVRFMITTGQPEFSEEIWPLVSSERNEVYLQTLRLARRFRPSVLGADAEKRLSELPDTIRGTVIAEIGMRSGYDGMEMAARLAKGEKHDESIYEIIQTLAFRRAGRHVTDIVSSAAKSVWQLIALKGYPEEIENEEINASIVEMRRELTRTENNPITVVGYLNLGWEDEDKTAPRLKELLESSDFPIKDQNAHGVIWQAAKKYPQIVAEALLHRAASGMETMYNSHEFVATLETVDDGPIAEAAIRGVKDRHASSIVSAVIGPVTVGKLIDEFIRLDEEYRANGAKFNQAFSNEYTRVKDAITTSRLSSFIPALLQRADENQPHRIKLLAELLARHGKDTESKPLPLDEETRQQVVATIDRWIDILQSSADANRHQLSVIAEAIQRVPHGQFTPKLQQMLERDLSDWTRARKELIASGGRKQTSDASHSYTQQYRKSFSAIGNADVAERMKSLLADPQFGFDAACVLMDIWNRDHPSNKDKRFGGWHDYSDAKAKRAMLMDKEYEVPTSEFSEAIFAVALDLAKQENEKEAHNLAFRLGKIALAMPYGRKDDEIAALLNVPQPFAAKRELITVAAMMGEIISADMLLAAFGELIAAGGKEPWRLEENSGELMNWVELFAFSDRPMAVLEILNQLPQEYHYPYKLRRLLTALKDSPHPDAPKVLQAMAAQNPELTNEDDWISALVDQKSLEAGQLLVELVCDGTIKLDRATRGWGISKQLTGYAAHYPALRTMILERYEQLAGGPVKAMFERTLIETADESFVLMLIDTMAKIGRTDDGRLMHAVEKLAIGQRPVEGWPEAFERFSVPLNAFRKALFALVAANDAGADLAKACLTKIDELRDEYGQINEEPRHPDITAGLPWPKIDD